MWYKINVEQDISTHYPEGQAASNYSCAFRQDKSLGNFITRPKDTGYLLENPINQLLLYTICDEHVTIQYFTMDLIEKCTTDYPKIGASYKLPNCQIYHQFDEPRIQHRMKWYYNCQCNHRGQNSKQHPWLQNHNLWKLDIMIFKT
jgi:hypothetical protein